jgi:hypothetical protein
MARKRRSASPQVKARYGLPVIKALSVSTADDLAAVEAYRGIADRFCSTPSRRRFGTAGRQWRDLRLDAS